MISSRLQAVCVDLLISGARLIHDENVALRSTRYADLIQSPPGAWPQRTQARATNVCATQLQGAVEFAAKGVR
jgi:hypothetical protein